MAKNKTFTCSKQDQIQAVIQDEILWVDAVSPLILSAIATELHGFAEGFSSLNIKSEGLPNVQ